ncbi:hypothetical protein SAMN05192555_11855 [Franzmannia pantelleriensis]|uniref:Uncharacterized protein n=1 Tax=Franzmannia pantelleriensis TaxID=48727 RepID=A0A1G9VN75_9GAMM|nr:hypothetical protein [Halomonas pantelleriensis]SDM73644.1 hypothetical protein SAMN05192555_11855 [Halomonas pantelleriensis]
MTTIGDRISVRELLHDLIPKLKATERFIDETLATLIEQAPPGDERARRERQQHAFQVNLTMIRMNLDHLLKRHAHLLDEVSDPGAVPSGPMLELDEHEQVALNSAIKLYQQTQAIQTG